MPIYIETSSPTHIAEALASKGYKCLNVTTYLFGSLYSPGIKDTITSAILADMKGFFTKYLEPAIANADVVINGRTFIRNCQLEALYDLEPAWLDLFKGDESHYIYLPTYDFFLVLGGLSMRGSTVTDLSKEDAKRLLFPNPQAAVAQFPDNGKPYYQQRAMTSPLQDSTLPTCKHIYVHIDSDEVMRLENFAKYSFVTCQLCELPPPRVELNKDQLISFGFDH